MSPSQGLFELHKSILFLFCFRIRRRAASCVPPYPPADRASMPSLCRRVPPLPLKVKVNAGGAGDRNRASMPFTFVPPFARGPPSVRVPKDGTRTGGSGGILPPSFGPSVPGVFHVLNFIGVFGLSTRRTTRGP